MIVRTRNNNFINVISNIPCDLSRLNYGRNSEILETIQTTEGKIEITLDKPRHEDIYEYVDDSQSPLK